MPRPTEPTPGDRRYVLGYTAGDEPGEQRRAIEAWCEAQDRFLVGVVEDRGGRHLIERGGLLEALLRVEGQGVGVLLLGSGAALPPSPMEIGVLAAATRRAGADLLVAGVADVLGGERDAIERALDAHQWLMYAPHVQRGLRRQREQGIRRGGVVPYGSTRDEDGRLHPEPGEQAAIKLARELSERGLSAAKIGLRLAELGFKPRGQKWHPNTVRYLLRGEDT